MGMSASQARLLSITSRLTNNEFRSQTITNAKLRLATETTQATKKYNEALDSEMLMYMNYDNNGDSTKTLLTHALINEYAPMKNQYILRNPGNKVLTSNVDAKNFTETANLYEFLDRYGLVEDKEYSTRKVIGDNPKWDDWKKEHDKWETEKPKKEKYKKIEHVYVGKKYVRTDRVWEKVGEKKVGEKPIKKWVHTNSKVYDAIANIPCFSYTQVGHRCYFHVLSALLGFGEHTTSDGHKFIVHDIHRPAVTQPDGEVTEGWSWCTCTQSEASTMDNLREEMKNDPVYDQAYDDELDTEKHGVVHPGGTGEDARKYNAGGTIGGNCWQKCIDLLWELHNNYTRGSSTGGSASEEELKKFWYFVEFDLGDGHLEDTTVDIMEDVYDYVEHDIYENVYDDKITYPGYEEDVKKWKKREHIEPPKKTMVDEEYLSDIIVNDQDKAQWYTNLWHVLNDSKTANAVDWKQLKTSWDSDIAEYGYKVSNKEKTVQQDMFEVLDTNLSESQEWLQFALEHGVVSMERATFRDPSVDSEKILEKTPKGFTWKTIIYTEATDIVSVPDDDAVTRAEVEHKKALKKIHAEEKKLDNDLKKLDTEHSALQAEYESIKETISKNIGRSFKMFS